MLKANQHFILSFFGPPVFAALACYGVYLLNFWLEMKTPVLMTAFLATAVIFNLIGRWAIERAEIAFECLVRRTWLAELG